MHPDAGRLFAADASLRAEADELLVRSGIGEILCAAGYHPVGSYPMRTMTWRDLDFERYEEPDWQRHWQVGTRLAETGWCWRLNCVDVYRQLGDEFGFYWGLRVSDPAGSRPGDSQPVVWKLDVWTARPEECLPRLTPLRATWAAAMTEEARSHILAIKDVVCREPGYMQSVLSVHIYEAVLEHGVRGLEEFRQWWHDKHGADCGG